MKRENIAKILAVIVSIVLVAILISQIQITNIITTLAKINPLYLLIGFGLYLCSYIFRTLRFRTLLNHKIEFKNLFSIVCIHNMVNGILPARTGELSYIYLVKTSKSISTGEAIATLAIARAFDFIAIILLFFISAMLVRDLPAVISNAFLTLAIFLIIIVLFVIFSVNKGKEFMDKIETIAKELNLKRFRVAEFLITKVNETASSFDIIHSKKLVFYSFSFSILIWSFKYYMFYTLLRGMNIDLVVTLVVLGSTFSQFADILPIPSLGAFGIYEGAWAIAFIPLGISKEMAISTGFGIHIILFIYFLILGCYGFLTIETKE